MMDRKRGDAGPSTLLRPKMHSRQWLKLSGLARTRARPTFFCDGVGVDLEGCVAWLSEGPVALRPLETRLLRLLSNHLGRVVPSEEIIRHLYGPLAMETGRLRLKTLVSGVRRRLGSVFAENLRTAHGIGLILYGTAHASDSLELGGAP